VKTEFQVLWVDDNYNWILANKDPLLEWLEDKGFELKIISHKNTEGVIDDIKQMDLELIIIDYKLGNERGDVLIKEIRANDCYQDIVFYSEGELPNVQLDGVFFVQREHTKSRIRELIDLKLKRLSDPASVRGWIVADSIELEGMINSILLACFSDQNGLTFSNRIFGDKIKLEFASKVFLLDGILKDKIKVLRSVNKPNIELINEWESCKTVFELFIKEIINQRNILAHQKAVDLTRGKIIKTSIGADIILDESYFTQTRKNIMKHRNNLDKIFQLIVG